MIHGRPCKHYGNGYEGAVAANAIAAVKEAGRVAVAYDPAQWGGLGFYAYWVREDGTAGLSLCSEGSTEAETWLSVAIHVAAYKPGVLQMTSREFGSVSTANVLCQDGSLGVLQRRSRLEIRKLSGQYEVFLVERRYLRGDDPRDVHQHPEGGPFAAVADAAAFIDQYIGDYEGAAADDREAAIDAQRDRERDER
uniref:Uncharacterized protein n=2 Tax=Burkholderia sp. M701 TaxID=326454 RepID=V5YMU0_9BURK|nr:hypothetical protein [Burkholderia sp. M701]